MKEIGLILKGLYQKHIAIRKETVEGALNRLGYEGMIISSGKPYTYFLDDQDAAFRSTPHFSHWTPLQGPNHVLHIVPGRKPVLLMFNPTDFWYEHSTASNEFWTEFFEIKPFNSVEMLEAELGGFTNHAFIGPEGSVESCKHYDQNPKLLLASLDWHRAIKSDYEIYCLQEANRLAAQAHLAARSAFIDGGSEIEIHHAYVSALKCSDDDLPYHSIVALDQHAAVLHYQRKRTTRNGRVLLIDSGANYFNYSSDITRTYAHKTASDTFKSLLKSMEATQKQICDKVTAGVNYFDLHDTTHQEITKILLDHEILNGCSIEAAIANGLSRVFFPHGLGHLLGIQVHDVGGLQKNEQGEPCDPSEKYPYLRTARVLRLNEVITVEPGLYFIPALIDPMRSGKEATYFDFSVIDELVPLGGIRIEDNLQVKDGSSLNLTRVYLGNEYLV